MNGPGIKPALPPFRFNALRGRALAGLWPALERLFIVSTGMSAQGIVAGQSSIDHGTRERPNGDHLSSAMRTKSLTRCLAAAHLRY